ncbi:hypothetical protein [Streptomyces sp. NBC_01092]|nr:hypothetical protein OG254_12415 [Streptomyces sp. NBC_01092]
MTTVTMQVRAVVRYRTGTGRQLDNRRSALDATPDMTGQPAPSW